MTIQERLNDLSSERANLLNAIAENDYRNIKNSEANLACKPIPYDPIVIYEKNSGYRKRVNEIDEEIEELKEIEEKSKEEPSEEE